MWLQTQTSLTLSRQPFVSTRAVIAKSLPSPELACRKGSGVNHFIAGTVHMCVSVLNTHPHVQAEPWYLCNFSLADAGSTHPQQG